MKYAIVRLVAVGIASYQTKTGVKPYRREYWMGVHEWSISDRDACLFTSPCGCLKYLTKNSHVVALFDKDTY